MSAPLSSMTTGEYAATRSRAELVSAVVESDEVIAHLSAELEATQATLRAALAVIDVLQALRALLVAA